MALQAAMINDVDAAVITTDACGVIAFWSAGAERLFGYSAADVLGSSIESLVGADQTSALARIQEARDSGHPLEGELDAVGSSGEQIPVFFRTRKVLSGEHAGRPAAITVVVDITARREALASARHNTEAQLEIADLGRRALRGESCEELFVRAVGVAVRFLSAGDAVLLERRAAEGTLVAVARSGGRSGQRSHGGVTGQEIWLAEHVLRTRKSTVVDDWEREPRLRGAHPSRSENARSSVAVAVGDTDAPFGVLVVNHGQPGGGLADAVPFLQLMANILADALLNREAHREIRRQGLHDSLTGLPNRGLFLDRVERSLEGRAADDPPLAVLMFDVDNFKLVNESLGHAMGDEMLRVTALRLQAAIRPGDTLARLAGGEFAVLCEQLPSVEAAGYVADRMLAAAHEPIATSDGERSLVASMGIAAAQPDCTAGELLRDADSAMSHAKSRGGGRYEVFESRMRERLLDRVRMEAALAEALSAGDQIRVEYQPLVSLRTGAITGGEALARWAHPSRGPIPPGDFIPVAEESGYIHELGSQIMSRALREAGAWLGQGEFAGIAVNVSPLQLADPAEVPALAEHSLAAAGMEPSFLTIEITEGVLLEELDVAGGVLGALADMGLGLSLDDFGTGYSSLGYLGELPFDSVKVDRSLTRDIVNNARAASLASAIVEMGHALGKVVIAEGIETAEQANLLQSLGCDVGQGFFFSRPLSPEAFGQLLRETPRFPFGSRPESLPKGRRRSGWSAGAGRPAIPVAGAAAARSASLSG